MTPNRDVKSLAENLSQRLRAYGIHANVGAGADRIVVYLLDERDASVVPDTWYDVPVSIKVTEPIFFAG